MRRRQSSFVCSSGTLQDNIRWPKSRRRPVPWARLFASATIRCREAQSTRFCGTNFTQAPSIGTVKLIRRVHAPIVTKDLWERAQAVLHGRHADRHRKMKHEFAFSGIVSRRHCGCSLVGEIKKGRYIYYYCTGYKRKCPAPYTREDVPGGKFADLLQGLVLDDEIVACRI